MADRLPIGEPRFVHFTESGATLQPGAWAGPTHVMVVEHRSDMVVEHRSTAATAATWWWWSNAAT